ncbi:MAG: response regulator [Thermoanaerobaculia bacterium]
MAEVLVVEDSPDQAALIAALLEAAGHATRSTGAAEAALEKIDSHRPDLVVTDLVMPGMDGLELVEAVRARCPDLPVVLVTAFGSGEIAVDALKKGAASYVPKPRLADDLITTVESVLALAREKRKKTLLLESLFESQFRFVLPNEENLIPGLVEFLQDRICYRHPEYDENELMQIGIAIQEAVRNAMHHGNLEVSSQLRQESVVHYNAKVEERLEDEVFARRRVTVKAEFGVEALRCRVRDEGPGFDPSTVPDPTDPENLLKTSGRGIYLITMFMDSVEYNHSGNEIVMTKRLAG